MGDAMKSLENRTLDSKREMDIIAALDEMKSMKVWEQCLFLPLSLSLTVQLWDLILFNTSATCWNKSAFGTDFPFILLFDYRSLDTLLWA